MMTDNRVSVRRRPGRPKAQAMEQDRNCQARLLEVAVKAFAVRSYDGVSLRTLAAAANCDVSMVAHHFGSKQDLWLATVEHMRERVLGHCEQIRVIEQSHGPIDARCMQAIEHLYEAMASEDEMVRFTMRERAEGSARFECLHARVIAPLFAAYRPIWQEAIDGGVLKLSPPGLLHTVLSGAIAFVLTSPPLETHLEGETENDGTENDGTDKSGGENVGRAGAGALERVDVKQLVRGLFAQLGGTASGPLEQGNS